MGKKTKNANPFGLLFLAPTPIPGISTFYEFEENCDYDKVREMRVAKNA